MSDMNDAQKQQASASAAAPEQPPPKIGAGKSIASVLGGALAIIVIFVMKSEGVEIPTDVAQAIQLVITTGLVLLVPHSFWSRS